MHTAIPHLSKQILYLYYTVCMHLYAIYMYIPVYTSLPVYSGSTVYMYIPTSVIPSLSLLIFYNIIQYTTHIYDVSHEHSMLYTKSYIYYIIHVTIVCGVA